MKLLRKYFCGLAVVTISISYSHANYRKVNEFKITREMRRANRITMPISEELKVFQQSSCWNLMGSSLQGERTQKTCLIFLDTLISAQKGTTLICKSWAGVAEGRLYRELLTELRGTEEIHRKWNLRCVRGTQKLYPGMKGWSEIWYGVWETTRRTPVKTWAAEEN